MIEVHEVEKRYGEVQALAGVSFTVQPGEVFGLLGHNGAGKSSLAKILVGLLRPDAGRATICGHDVVTDARGARAAFGYLAEESILYEELTAREHLELIGVCRRRRRSLQRLAHFGRRRTGVLCRCHDDAQAADVARRRGRLQRGLGLYAVHCHRLRTHRQQRLNVC